MNEQHPNQFDEFETGDRGDTDDGSDTGEGSDTGDSALLIDCGTCVARETDACSDCLVTFLCDVEPRTEAVVFDLDEIRAVRLLAKAGMVPTLRHRASS